MNIHDFQRKKNAEQKITLLTCYDYLSAQIIENTTIDAVLVGDSVAMVVHGYPSTTHATLEMMATHTAAVARGIKTKFIIADLPFMSYRRSLSATCTAVTKLIQAGAHAVKLEGADGNIATIQHLVASGVPVIGHIGLTPQSVNMLGGHKIQGKDASAASHLISNALALEQAGCFALVIECVPWPLAEEISQQLTIPTIGIGAGPHVSGQILVLTDLLGLQHDFKPKFLKTYINTHALWQDAINSYAAEVSNAKYPRIDEHSYC